MAATVIRTQVTLHHDSAMAEDDVVNVWHATIPDGTSPAAGAANFHAALVNFYTAVNAGSTADIEGFLASTLSGLWDITSYDLADAKPRVPILETVPAVLVPGSAALPLEVALCLTFAGPKVSGENQRRRTGRVYLGPFSPAVGVVDSTTARPNTAANALVDTIAAAGTALLAASTAATTWKWAVYSPTNNSAVNVTQGYVDNAWDTQRRRGNAPTARQNI